MKQTTKLYTAAFILFIIVIGFILTVPDLVFQKPIIKNRMNHHWQKINNQKTIRAITQNNSTGYFIYKGKPMGFHYDLLKGYCEAKGFKLKVIVEDDLVKALKMIKQGKADILAIDLTYSNASKKVLNFTNSYAYDHQVLVQREKSKKDSVEFITTVLALEGKKIYVQKGSAFKDQLEFIKQQTGTNFIIFEDTSHTMEELITMVSDGEIDFTVSNERHAKAVENFMSNLNYSLPLSVDQHLCWAVPPKEDSLKTSINNWINDFTESKHFKSIERKYYTSKNIAFHTTQSNTPIKAGGLTPYDKQIKKYAKQIGWDWRLLASLIYQESKFNNEVSSWSGAVGLMQVMPETAQKMGVADPYSVEGSLDAGTKFIKRIDRILAKTVTDSAERVKFVLAAYNCGLGHIQDAQRLTEKYGKNPNIWTDNTDNFLILKYHPKYYKDPVVKFGSYPGKHTYEFVNEILSRYVDYMNLVKL